MVYKYHSSERTETILFFFYGHSWDSAGKYFRDFFITYRAINLLKLSTSRHSVVFRNFQPCLALGANTVNHLNPPVHIIGFFLLLVLWAYPALSACVHLFNCLSFTPLALPYIPNGLYQAAFLFSQKIALYIATFLHPHGRFLCILYNSAKTETAQLQSLFLQNPVHTMHG